MPYPGVSDKLTPKMERCVKELMSQGKSKSSAIAICHDSIMGNTKTEKAKEKLIAVVKEVDIEVSGIEKINEMKGGDKNMAKKEVKNAVKEEAKTVVVEKKEEAVAEESVKKEETVEVATDKHVQALMKMADLIDSVIDRLNAIEEKVTKQAPAEEAAAADGEESPKEEGEKEVVAEEKVSEEEKSPEEKKEEAPVKEEAPEEEEKTEEAEEEADKKADKAEDVQKVDTPSEGAGFDKVLESLSAIEQRIKKLEEQPAPSKIVVSRELFRKSAGEDSPTEKVVEIEKRLQEILDIKNSKPESYTVELTDEALALIEEKKRLKGEIV